MWNEFLGNTFSVITVGKSREDFESLSRSEDVEVELTRKEFDDTLKYMKNEKAVGVDNIPTEVWTNSKVTKDVMFNFLNKVWKKEEVQEKFSDLHIHYDIQK